MPTLLGEIKSRVSGVSRAPRDIAGMVKSKAKNILVTDRAVRQLTNRIGDSGIVGQDNYNKHAKEVQRLLKEGKGKQLQTYVRQQREKVIKEQRDEKRLMRLKREMRNR